MRLDGWPQPANCRAQAGTMCFITWRTADSMPREVVERWIAERNGVVSREGIRVDLAGFSGFGETRLHWKKLVQRLAPQAQWKLQCDLTDRFESHLDACHGACLLRRRELAAIVGESLQKFSGDRYGLTDFVVMPNHVHMLAGFPDEITRNIKDYLPIGGNALMHPWRGRSIDSIIAC